MNRYWKTALDLDRRMRKAGINYCVIKCYDANPDFNDSNIDVVCDVPLAEVYQRAYADYALSTRDRTKARFYEHNKLMVKHPTGETSDIHLHTNAGWHDIEFVSGQEILAKRREYPLPGGSTQILETELDAKILTLQVMFENFKKKRWDAMLLRDEDYAAFASEYGVTAEEIAPVQQAEEYISIAALRPIWRKYYAKRKSETRITPWNHTLHWLFVALSEYRRVRSAV